jgi:hypothetical protein
MQTIASTIKMGAATTAIAAATAVMPLPAAQATPAVPAPEVVGNVLGISCVVGIGDDCGVNGSGTGEFFHLGSRKLNPPERFDFFVINPTIPLSLIPIVGPPLAGWFATINFEVCVGGLGARIGPYGKVSASVGRGC